MTRHLSRRLTLSLLAGASFAMTQGLPALASDGPITIIVPYAAGGINDAFGRKIADGLSREIGRTVLVENKPGANGILAATHVARAKNDGTTLFLTGTGPLSLNTMLRDNIPFTADSFDPVAMMFDGVLTISVPTALGVSSLEELIAHARKTGRPLRYGTQGPGSVMDLYGRIFSQHFGVEMVPVAYKNNPSSLVDLLGGQLEVSFVSPMSLTEYAKAGTVKILALTGSARDPQWPDIPTVGELGHSNLEISYWTAIHAPAGLPEDLKQAYAAAIVKTVNSPDFLELLSNSGQYPKAGGPEVLAAQMQTDRETWGAIIEKNNLRIRE